MCTVRFVKGGVTCQSLNPTFVWNIWIYISKKVAQAFSDWIFLLFIILNCNCSLVEQSTADEVIQNDSFGGLNLAQAVREESRAERLAHLLQEMRSGEARRTDNHCPLHHYVWVQIWRAVALHISLFPPGHVVFSVAHWASHTSALSSQSFICLLLVSVFLRSTFFFCFLSLVPALKQLAHLVDHIIY